MEKRRKRMIKQCLSFALSLVMALTIVTPVKAAQQQYVPTQEDIEITKNIKDIQITEARGGDGAFREVVDALMSTSVDCKHKF